MKYSIGANGKALKPWSLKDDGDLFLYQPILW